MEKKTTEEVETETVVPVTTVAAEVGTIRAVIHATGDVNPAPNAELLVVAPEPARITEITKAEGDRVRRGEVLVRFEIPTLNADAISKGAEATAAAARLENAKANQVRMKDLFERGVAARKEVEDADREVADAQAALAQAQAGHNSSQTLANRQTVTRDVRWRDRQTIAQSRRSGGSRRPAIRSCASSIRRACRWMRRCRYRTCHESSWAQRAG